MCVCLSLLSFFALLALSPPLSFDCAFVCVYGRLSLFSLKGVFFYWGGESQLEGFLVSCAESVARSVSG